MLIGAGQVGTHVARTLCSSHQVTLVDTDPERLQKRENELDVLTTEGDGALVSTLREAGVQDADMLVACTADDKTNIVACGMSKILGDPFTLARVNRTDYLESWREGRRALGVDSMVGAKYLTARSIRQLIGLPLAREIDFFASGQIQLAEFDVPENSPIHGQTIQEIDQSIGFEVLSFLAVFSDEEFIFPRGETSVHTGDRLLVAGSSANVHRFSQYIVPRNKESSVENISIFGAGEVGYLVARAFDASDYTVQVIEKDPERAREVAEELPNTLVHNHDATDGEFLKSEAIDKSDVAIASLDSDEKNLLVSVFAKNLGAKRTFAVVDKDDYLPIFENVGIDVVVNPRLLTAEEIIRFSRRKETRNIAILESDEVEVLEVLIDDDSQLAEVTIQEAASRLPREVVFGPIRRNQKLIRSRGDTLLKPGDHILILAHIDHVATVEAEL